MEQAKSSGGELEQLGQLDEEVQRHLSSWQEVQSPERNISGGMKACGNLESDRNGIETVEWPRSVSVNFVQLSSHKSMFGDIPCNLQSHYIEHLEPTANQQLVLNTCSFPSTIACQALCKNYQNEYFAAYLYFQKLRRLTIKYKGLTGFY